MNSKQCRQPVLAIHPTRRGLGFCVFDTPENLLDWGYSNIRFNKNARTLGKLKSLIDLYQPEYLIVEDINVESSKRKPRLKKLITTLTKAAIGFGVAVHHYSPEQIGQVFDSKNKQKRAESIAKVLPELAPYLPPKRRLWESEHAQMQVFEAVSLALTYFYQET
jgi:hypothetical protein